MSNSAPTTPLTQMLCGGCKDSNTRGEQPRPLSPKKHSREESSTRNKKNSGRKETATDKSNRPIQLLLIKRRNL